MTFKADYTRFLEDEAKGAISDVMEKMLKHGLVFARKTAPVGTYQPKSFIRSDGTRVSKSPKGYVPGAYRKSIQFSKGAPINGTLNVYVDDPFQKYYIYSDSPYANAIEYGHMGKKPWSEKAPDGVFGITAVSMNARFGQ